VVVGEVWFSGEVWQHFAAFNVLLHGNAILIFKKLFLQFDIITFL